MPLYQHKCDKCGLEQEKVTSMDVRHDVCDVCGEKTHRIPAVCAVNMFNSLAPWVGRVARSAIDRDTKDPEAREILRNPTRDNLVPYLEKNNLRVATKDNHGKRKKDDFDIDRVTKKLLDKSIKRNSVEVTS